MYKAQIYGLQDKLKTMYYYFYSDAFRCVFLYRKGMKICHPTQHFNAMFFGRVCTVY